MPLSNLIKRFFQSRLHVYQQLEHSDCGQTCIRILLHYYGIRISQRELNSLIEGSRQGMSIGEVRATLEKLGFETATVRLNITQLLEAPLPCIVYWNQNHFVFLYKINSSKGRYYIIDPAEGKRKINADEFGKAFLQNEERGIVVLAEPTTDFSARPSTSSFDTYNPQWGLLSRHIRANKWQLLIVLLLMLLCMVADIVVPFLFQHTVDDGIGNRDIHLIWLLIFSQLGIFLGGYVTSNFTSLILTKLGLKVGIDLLNEYLSKLVRMPMHFFSRKVNSDFIQKAEDHTRLRMFLVNLPHTLILTFINLIVFGGLLIYFNTTIFFIFIGLTSINILWVIVFLRYRRELDSALSTNSAENRNNLFEIINGIDEIKANNAHHMRIKGWHEVQTKINKLTLKSSYLGIFQNGGTTLVVRVRDVVISGLCATLVAQDAMTLGVMMTVSYVAGRLAAPFNSILSLINETQDAHMALNRVEEVHSFETKNIGTNSIKNIESIRIKNLSFSYPGFNNPKVLRSINLEIPVGKVTAIVGESGSGKSSLLKLLLGFFMPQCGSVEINGKELSSFNEEEWLEKVAIVMQNATLFSTSILNNIAIADAIPDIERVRKTARLAQIDEFISNLPMGYNTRIGTTGLDLSGGQRQRLFIARAIYRNPEILILDEASSSLDAITEEKIMNNLYGYFKGRTIIVAAHRLSTVKNADKIVVLKNGEVVEVGNHTQLINKQGYYAALVACQIST